MPPADTTTRIVLRTVLIVVCVVLTLYVIYLLRKPLGWLVIATFLATAMSGPVNLLGRRLHRGLAIFVAYLGLLAIPILLAAILVPPIVNGVNDLASQAPEYAAEARDFVDKNPRLRELERDYGVVTRLEEEARKLPERAGTAANILADIGVGVVNSIFAGITGFIVMKILGIPFAGPLAVLVGVADLIPLVGATIAAVLVGIVTLFADFPIDTILWAGWAIVYQQLENTVIQPQIQRRAVALNPFVVLVSVLFGSTLFGVAGALLAIPVAASLQIAVTEWWHFRQSARAELLTDP